MILETERLVLRPFFERDREPFVAMNSDPEVMRYFPEVMSRAEANALMGRIEAARSRAGYSLLAAALKDSGEFIGFIGLLPIEEPLKSALRGRPDTEIGWRLAREHWGKGYAPEGARACLDFAWDVLNAPEVVAITYHGNAQSIRVMEKIGMERDPKGDFAHPKLPADHRVSTHVLYRIENPR